MAAVGQKMRKPMTDLLGRLEACHFERRTAACRDAEQWSCAGWRKQDDAFPIPRSADAIWRIRYHLRGPAGNVDPLELAIGEKSDGPAVGRPERKCGVFCSRQRLRGVRLERPKPELRFPCSHRLENGVAPVG